MTGWSSSEVVVLYEITQMTLAGNTLLIQASLSWLAGETGAHTFSFPFTVPDGEKATLVLSLTGVSHGALGDETATIEVNRASNTGSEDGQNVAEKELGGCQLNSHASVNAWSWGGIYLLLGFLFLRMKKSTSRCPGRCANEAAFWY